MGIHWIRSFLAGRKQRVIVNGGKSSRIYESDKYVPTGEQNQGSLGVGFRRKKGGHWVWEA